MEDNVAFYPERAKPKISPAAARRITTQQPYMNIPGFVLSSVFEKKSRLDWNLPRIIREVEINLYIPYTQSFKEKVDDDENTIDVEIITIDTQSYKTT